MNYNDQLNTKELTSKQHEKEKQYEPFKNYVLILIKRTLDSTNS